MSNEMHGKICVVTGANSGIGRETARGLARMGAHVVMVCRNAEKGRAALEDIRRETGIGQIDLLIADLSAQQAVRDVAAQIKTSYPRLDVLVNNVGAMFSKRRLSPDGLEATMALNHLNVFLLTLLLLDLLKASAPSRIINVSSAAHERAKIDLDDLQFERRKYRGFAAYGQSKLMMNLFTVELARRLKGTGVTVNSLHPGLVFTNFGNDGGSGAFKMIFKLLRPFMLTSEQGAQTTLHVAASAEGGERSGEYFAKSRVAKANPLSLDPQLAAKLWQISERLTGVAPSVG
jgi:NAD(P)-dependent dehydrogenase (short-subunit alcohol dehydrogenase family)